MERHNCKLCSRKFSNGKALGGHMKAHLATLPLPPKPKPLLNHHTASFSSSFSSSEEEEQEHEAGEKTLVYGLRENPKKSFRLSDPESVVVQDRESETESKNPTRRRSRRTRKPLQKQAKLMTSFMESPEPVSSVSDTSPEEDVAMCLMMLSRDKWGRNNNIDVNVVVVVKEEQEEEVERSTEKKKSKGLFDFQEIKFKKVRGKHQCENCGKKFRSSGALGSHRSICVRGDDDEVSDDKIFQCPFCEKVFGSGQALGGHKRSHLYPSSSSTSNNNDASGGFKQSFFDLNLPASPEEDDDGDLSVVSDA